MNASGASPANAELEQFVTTRWSMVLSCGDSQQSEAAQQALAYLCRVYWRPVLAFICRHGIDHLDAQDLTQEFFVKIMRGELLHNADPARGRFRALLRKALGNFLSDMRERDVAKKRGGNLRFVSWEDWMSEMPSQLNLPAFAVENWSAEQLFDARWAATVVEQALRRLREECEACGRRRVFDVLSSHLASDRAEACYPQLARQLGLPVETVKSVLRRLRQRYRELLRDEVATTVGTRAEIDDEIRYLCSSLVAVP